MFRFSFKFFIDAVFLRIAQWVASVSVVAITKEIEYLYFIFMCKAFIHFHILLSLFLTLLSFNDYLIFLLNSMD